MKRKVRSPQGDYRELSNMVSVAKLKFFRVTKRLSQADLALATGITTGRIHRAEEGNAPYWFTSAEIDKLAAALGVRPDQIL
jgi:transcriptional regulator with XRE-family HTH domain